ncbi:MAG: hypothetical protein WB975_11185 [Nitrososphaeraceae archaeon]
MSEFAFFRFKSTNMLTLEEEQHKDEVIKITEEVLDAKGIECDAKIAKISEDKLREILDEVRKLRKRRKKNSYDDESKEEEGEKYVEEEAPYVK